VAEQGPEGGARLAGAGGSGPESRMEAGRTSAKLRAEHGFAALVTFERNGRRHSLLFYSGVSPDGLVENLRRLQLSPKDFEAIVRRAEELAARGPGAFRDTFEQQEGLDEYEVELDPYTDQGFRSLVRTAIEDLPLAFHAALEHVAVVGANPFRARSRTRGIEQKPEIIGADGDFPLHEDRAGVYALIDPEDRDAGLVVAHAHSPVDGAPPAVARTERRSRDRGRHARAGRLAIPVAEPDDQQDQIGELRQRPQELQIA